MLPVWGQAHRRMLYVYGMCYVYVYYDSGLHSSSVNGQPYTLFETVGSKTWHAGSRPGFVPRVPEPQGPGRDVLQGSCL